MKKIFGIIGFLVVAAVVIGIIFGGGDNASQGEGTADKGNAAALGDYEVVIEGCRLAKAYDGRDIAIVSFKFTNAKHSEAKSFLWSITDQAFQNGVELSTCYTADGYNHELAEKEIKQGATITVEQAYYLNDTTTEIEVEVSEYMSFSGKKITKKFSI